MVIYKHIFLQEASNTSFALACFKNYDLLVHHNIYGFVHPNYWSK